MSDLYDVSKELTLAIMNKIDVKPEQTMKEYTDEVTKVYKTIYQALENPRSK
jgi:hypothetical protein